MLRPSVPELQRGPLPEPSPSVAPRFASGKPSRERTTRRRRWQRAVHAQLTGSRSEPRSRTEARTLQFESSVLVSLPTQTSGIPKSCRVHDDVTPKRGQGTGDGGQGDGDRGPGTAATDRDKARRSRGVWRPVPRPLSPVPSPLATSPP